MKKYSEAARKYPEMLEDLRRVAKKLGHTPTADEYRKHGSFATSTLINRFGSYNNALAQANLEPARKTYNDDEIIEDLKRVSKMIGHVPVCSEYRKYGKVSVQTIFRRFGNWIDLLRSAGFKHEANVKADAMKIVTEDEIFADYCRIARKLGHPPTVEEYKKFGAHSYYRLRKVLGGIHNARERYLKEYGKKA